MASRAVLLSLHSKLTQVDIRMAAVAARALRARAAAPKRIDLLQGGVAG